MTIVALVPARGGSRGLAGKNLAMVGGQSLVGRAIAAAAEVAAIDEIVISSDDHAILAAGAAAGATPLQRPAALAADTTPTLDVVRGFLQARSDINIVVVLQPTSPLRTAADIEQCLRALDEAQTVATVTAVEHPVEWTFRMGSAGHLDPVFGWDMLAARRQDSPPTYRLNGAVYVARAEHIRTGGQLLDSETVGVVMPRHRSVDIDDGFDLLIAQAFAEPAPGVTR